jgi:hypothetical protein
MVLFWPILAPKYEVPKLNTPKYVTLQKLTAKIEHCLNIFLYKIGQNRTMTKISRFMVSDDIQSDYELMINSSKNRIISV